jgi:hypothetical protein
MTLLIEINRARSAWNRSPLAAGDDHWEAREGGSGDEMAVSSRLVLPSPLGDSALTDGWARRRIFLRLSTRGYVGPMMVAWSVLPDMLGVKLFITPL